MKLKEVLKPALILCVICLLATAALAGTNMLTADTIAQQKVITEQESRKQVLPDADSFEEADGYAIGKAGSDVAGYVFVTSAKGYGGDVPVMVGITSDGTISAIQVMDNDETPGVGKKVMEADFTDQFKGKTGTDGVAAVSGATYSSNAVFTVVDAAMSAYQTVKEA